MNVQLFKCFNAILKVSLSQNLHKIYINFLFKLRNVITCLNCSCFMTRKEDYCSEVGIITSWVVSGDEIMRMNGVGIIITVWSVMMGQRWALMSAQRRQDNIPSSIFRNCFLSFLLNKSLRKREKIKAQQSRLFN